MIPPFPQPSGLMPGILYLRRELEYRFWPHDVVALLRDEETGRVEATSTEGEVAHCVAAWSEFEHPPWVRVAPGVLVHPAHARQRDGHLHLPGGWRIPHQGRLPRRRPQPPPEPFLPGTRLRPSDVLEIRLSPRQVYWITDQGEVPAACTPEEAARWHGDLTSIGARHVNRRRVRAMFAERGTTWLVFDNGQRLPMEDWSLTSRFRVAVGLPARQSEEAPMPPLARSLFVMGLRDHPFDLFEAPAETLREICGGVAEHLVAHVLWQTFRWRREGRDLTWGTGYRAYWYRPLLPILARAGFLQSPDSEAALRQYDDEALYLLYQRVCARMIAEHHLFTHSALGFEDPRPDLHEVGARHPETVLLCEKMALLSTVRRLAARFGVSYQVFHGQPKLLGTEYLAKSLRPHVQRKLRIVTLVDYDYSGHIIANAFVGQLAQHDLESASLDHLVTPDRFTRTELALFSHPITAARQQATKLRQWVKETGGIGGKPRGIYSDHLQPYERVERAFREVTGLGAVRGNPALQARTTELPEVSHAVDEDPPGPGGAAHRAGLREPGCM